MGAGVDMRSTTKTRVQRRIEKKQAVLLVALVLIVSIASFALGLMVGRHTAEPIVVEQISEPRRIVVADSSLPVSEQKADAIKAEEEKLTFYDNLSKAEPAPIGSGINLPPVSDKVLNEKATTAQPQEIETLQPPPTAEVVAAVEATKSTPISAPAPVVASVDTSPDNRLPTVIKGGGWVVQVFASQSAADAGILRDKLNSKGYPAYITEADLGKKGIWYRVLFGPYADKASAVQAQVFAEKQDKLKGFVKSR